MNHIENYLNQAAKIARMLDPEIIERIVSVLVNLRERNGRLFLIGVGGSAANCSHAVNDFRKICAIESYTPVDNVAEITARTNDEGWDTVFVAYLRTSQANDNDAIMVLSVGGGDTDKGVSVNIVHALDEAKHRGLRILGIVGRDGGYTKKVGDAVLVIPTMDPDMITPYTEAFQAVVLHGIICHPDLMINKTKWEGLSAGA